METPKKLNPRQRRFVKEYVKTGNGTQSVLKTYNTNKPRNASVLANKLLKKPLIQKGIEEAMMEAGYDIADSVRDLQKASRLGLGNEKSAKVSDSIRANEILLKLSGVVVDRKASVSIKADVSNLPKDQLLKLNKKYNKYI